MNFLKIALFVALSVGLTACGSLSRFVGSTPITRNIDDEAIALNNAHARSINGVITVNILRARDRWPTGYTTLSGVRFSPTRTLGGTLTLDPLGIRSDNPVGEGREAVARPLAGSNYSATSTMETGAQYSVNPFAEQDNSESLYSTEQSEGLFRRYYEGGWPPTVVLALFVDSVSDGSTLCRIDGDGELAQYLNNLKSPLHRAAFNTKYPSSGHTCHDVFDAFKTVSSDPTAIVWKYDDSSKYSCKGGKCASIDRTRRTRIRQGLETPVVTPNKNVAEPCSAIANASTGLMQDLLRGKTAEGLGAKVTAINSSSGRELVITPSGLHLCNTLSSSRLFFQSVTTTDPSESNSQIIRRMFNAYQDHALVRYLLEKEADYSVPGTPKAKNQTVSGAERYFDDCLAELSAISQQPVQPIGPLPMKAAPKCETNAADFRQLLLLFAADQNHVRPFRQVNFRSFDDMVHFVGETLRLDSIDANLASGTIIPKDRNGLCIDREKTGLKACKRTLFEVDRRGSIDRARQVVQGHGVKVQHAGNTWHVLPELDTKDVKVGPDDRTGTVLTILSQIYLLNQSSEFLEAPDNVLVR